MPDIFSAIQVFPFLKPFLCVYISVFQREIASSGSLLGIEQCEVD